MNNRANGVVRNTGGEKNPALKSSGREIIANMMNVMRKKKYVWIGVVVLIVLAGTLSYVTVRRDALLKDLLVTVLNKSTVEYFKGTARLKEAHLDKTMRIHIKGFYGELQTEGGALPLEVGWIESVDPVWALALGKPFRLRFARARVSGSREEGLGGQAVVNLGKDWSTEIRADIESLGLGSLEKLSPDNLEGSTGFMEGTFYFRQDAAASDFKIVLAVKEPGGLIQARFFDVLLPYLPEIPNRAELEKISGTAKLIPYRTADLDMKLIDPSRMKVFFHILVPDYNLNLNLNIEIRVDKDNAFFQIAQLFGLIKIAEGKAAVQEMAA